MEKQAGVWAVGADRVGEIIHDWGARGGPSALQVTISIMVYGYAM